MATATLQVKLNGGAPQTGGIVAALNDVVQLTAADKTGWGSPATRWEIYEYPPGFTRPSGWLQDTDDADAPTFYTVGSTDPPTFTMSLSGPYVTRLIVTGTVIDESTCINVPTPLGLHKTGRREGAQYGGQKRRYLRKQNDNLDLLEAAIASIGTDAGAALGDNSTAITVAAGLRRTLPAATLTANRNPTLSTTGAVKNQLLWITREDLTAFTYTLVNGGTGAGNVVVMPAGIRSWAIAEFDGTNWIHRASGTGLGS